VPEEKAPAEVEAAGAEAAAAEEVEAAAAADTVPGREQPVSDN